MADVRQTGWSLRTLTGGGGRPTGWVPTTSREQVLKLRGYGAPATTVTSARAAPAPVTPTSFATSPVALTDPTLASRAFSSVPSPAAPKSVAATGSVYGTAGIPYFLGEQVAALNATQQQRADDWQYFINRLLDQALKGDYMAWEALRAAGVAPGAKVVFGSPILDPLTGAGQVELMTQQAGAAAAQASTQRQAAAIPWKLEQLREELRRLGPTPFGQYEGSRQQQLERQIVDLQLATPAVSRVGAAAAGAGTPSAVGPTSGFVMPGSPSGWVMGPMVPW